MTHHSEIIDRFYPADATGPARRLRELYLDHCTAVTTLALRLAWERLRRPEPPELDLALLEHCAMLHDLGIIHCHAPSIHCHGPEPYLRHGLLGARMLREAYGPAEEQAARVCELHTGAGITAAEIKERSLPLPQRDFLPQTPLERLVCYADKFFSKSAPSPHPLPLESVRASMARFGAPALQRFEALHAEWGSPRLFQAKLI